MIKEKLQNNIFVIAFKNLRWFEWVMFLAMIVIGAFYMVTDKTHPHWYLVVNYICSIMGISCIFLCAHASWPKWIVGIINTVLYSIILFYNHVYGTFALEMLYYLPCGVVGLYLWTKHLDNKEKDKCKTRVMSWKLRLLMFVIVVTSSLTLRYFLVKIGGATPLLDAITVSLGVIATFYEIKRYADQYALWLISDVLAITQWILLGDVIMITKKSIYFVMSIIGIINWTRMQKERNTENS